MVLRRLLGLAGLGPGPDAKDIEIAVLRQLRMYPVCLRHAEVIDRYCALFPEWARSEALRDEAAHLIKEAECLIRESQDRRFDLQDDQGWPTD